MRVGLRVIKHDTKPLRGVRNYIHKNQKTIINHIVKLIQSTVGVELEWGWCLGDLSSRLDFFLNLLVEVWFITIIYKTNLVRPSKFLEIN